MRHLNRDMIFVISLISRIVPRAALEINEMPVYYYLMYPYMVWFKALG